MTIQKSAFNTCYENVKNIINIVFMFFTETPDFNNILYNLVLHVLVLLRNLKDHILTNIVFMKIVL